MGNNGYILLHRKIINTSLFGEEKHNKISAWIYLLLRANYEDDYINRSGEKFKITRGAFHTSIKNLSTELNWSVKKTRNYLKELQNLGMIKTFRDKDGTTIYIQNYEKYQTLKKKNKRTVKWYAEGHAKGHTKGHTPNARKKPSQKEVQETDKSERAHQKNRKGYTSNKYNKHIGSTTRQKEDLYTRPKRTKEEKEKLEKMFKEAGLE